MPIGKNAIKRVNNNGYSNVQTSAPDMENSVIAEVEEKKETAKKSTSSVAPKTQKKTTPKAPTAQKAASTSKKTSSPKTELTPKKSMETEPDLNPVKTAEKVVSNNEREGDGYVNLGGKLPYYLL